MSWDPYCYNKLHKERLEPFEDLLKLVKKREGLKVIDLGCGTGETTSMLADKLPGSRIVGIDSSPDMLKKATEWVRPGLTFEMRSIENLSGKWDLIFSNAAIHWLDKHDELVPKFFSHINPGGQLVIQIPSNQNHPSQTLLSKVAQEDPFRDALDGWVRVSPVLQIHEYADLLYLNNGTNIIVFEKVYPHVLKDVDAVVNWMRGSALIPYLERLPNKFHDSFLESYKEKIIQTWPTAPIFFPFRRTLFSASVP
ncbi:methyltransferase domain-containing protein [Desulfobacterota bacterium AH_259_B03_O07]|nr:methyltransferase domain-containing protein [Desulfobacterota bacterium AH_259_B03_O07]